MTMILSLAALASGTLLIAGAGDDAAGGSGPAVARGPGAGGRQLLLDTASRPLHTVDPRFASVTFDIGGLDRPLLPLAPRLRDLARAGPTYLRVGGAAGDCIYWNVSNNVALPLPPPSARCANEGPRRVASRQTVDELLQLCDAAGVLLVLGLNSADGRSKNHRAWDPAHTTALLRYLASHPLRGAVAGFELGNEPRSEKYGFRLTGAELGRDIVMLRGLVAAAFGGSAGQPEGHGGQGSGGLPILVGPDQDQDQDCIVPHQAGVCAPCLLDWCWKDTQGCIETARPALAAVTFHYYPLKQGLPYNGSQLLMEPALLDKVHQRVAPYAQLAAAAEEGQSALPVWLGEGASAGHGGIDNVSNSFESGFWYLDELGLLAKLGVSVMCRQQISADGYGLVTKALVPMPDFFTAILHKRLLGTTVLNATVLKTDSTDDGMVRVYAHCGRNGSGTVALSFVNLLGSPVELTLPAVMATVPRQEWHLSAQALSSRTMMLNGEALELTADGTLPAMPPVRKGGHSAGGSNNLVLGGSSYGFVVLELGARAGGVCAMKTGDEAAHTAPVACGLALTASRCVIRGRATCWDCIERHSEALRLAGCNDSALTSWCQYGTCALDGAFATAKYCDHAASLEVRADALVGAATLPEKLSMLPATNDGVPRLGLPAFMFTECLHGLKVDCGGDGEACPSIFPAPIALAATLNASLWADIGSAIGTENRGLYNTGGLDQLAFPYCWAPNNNLVRDGRWGRIGETSGEDVLLTTRYMLAWVRGLQRGGGGGGSSEMQPDEQNRSSGGGGGGGGAGPDQALATCKHWSGYSLEGQAKPTATGPPATYPSRHQFDAVVSKQDLVDFYFPVFEACAKDADVASVRQRSSMFHGRFLAFLSTAFRLLSLAAGGSSAPFLCLLPNRGPLPMPLPAGDVQL